MNNDTLADRKSIEGILVDYATALDSKQYHLLGDVFTADAQVEYTGIGHCDGLAEVQALVSGVLDQCAETQHILSNYRIDIDGDTARARCYLQALHVGKGDFSGKTLTVWGEYSDELQRIAGSWRIHKRQLRTLHSEGDIGLN